MGKQFKGGVGHMTLESMIRMCLENPDTFPERGEPVDWRAEFYPRATEGE